jgi:DNA mismatch repair protein MutS
MTINIVKEYMNYVETYKNKYGPNVVVLMEVGVFYEIYDDGSGKVDIHQIADICNLNVSQKNRKNSVDGCASIESPNLAGFHTNNAFKYQSSLLAENYTCIIVSQLEKQPGQDRFSHKVTSILSPSTILGNSKINNYLASLYFEEYNGLITVGMSLLDVSTGHNYIHEVISTSVDPDYARDEIYRVISILSPTELIIVCSKKHPLSPFNKNLMIHNIQDLCNSYLEKWEDYEHIQHIEKISYQVAILNKAYDNKSQLPIIEYVGVDKLNIARVALCISLCFGYEHNEDYIKGLNLPVMFEENKHLNIEYNSIIQLNMISLLKNDNSVVKILNKCKTPFGYRAFYEQLMSPITDIDILNKRYDKIDYLKKLDVNNISQLLSGVIDLEKIKRKIYLRRYMPNEWQSFSKSCSLLKNVFKLVSDNDIIEVISNLEAGFNHIILDNNVSNLSELENNIFIKSHLVEVDNLEREKEKQIQTIHKISETIFSLSPNNDNTLCKVEKHDKEGYHILITKKRYENAKKIDKSYMETFTKNIISQSNSNYKLTSPDIDNVSKQVAFINQEIKELVVKEYDIFLKGYIIENEILIDKLINRTIEIDIGLCIAKLAIENKLCRPILINNKEKSSVDFTGIRHPIIEIVNNNIEFVKNDVSVNVEKNGILLYGINASGKSSLMKAIGINTILAQCGIFVFANSMKLAPYQHIFTRISGADNIYKNMSSFTVEMTELRNILKRCGSHSLVIGDEICSGTENVSGCAIVASSISTLVKKQASFVFATHLHELIDIDVVKSITDNIRICHLSMRIDNNTIIYDRKLKDGSGSKIYGIEVCRSLDMPKEFLINAEKIRKEIMNISQDYVSKKQSRYSSHLYMDMCAVCKVNKAKETHHIQYQSQADEDNFIDTSHKNSLHNLVPLCQECHKKEHKNLINIQGYIQTSKGIVLETT